MALFADRVKETSTTTGTGTYTLGGTVSSFRTFSATITSGKNCYYMATDGTDWEVAIGTFNTTLARTTIIASSNAGAAVNWGVGTRVIYVVAPANIFNAIGVSPIAPTTLPDVYNTFFVSGLLAVGDGAKAYESHSIATGFNSKTYAIGQWAHGAGLVDVDGDAQKTEFTADITTSNATATNMEVAFDPIVLPDNRMYGFLITILAIQYGGSSGTNGDSWSQIFTGAIKNDGTNSIMVGTTASTTAISSGAAGGLSAQILAGGVGKTLDIEVTGEADKNFRWAARIETTEISQL